MTGVRLIDRYKAVILCSPQTPSTFTSQWVNFQKFSHGTIILAVKNATTVTGSAVTLSQAVDISGTSSKALPFNLQWSNIATATTDALTQNTVSSNTFTTNATDSVLSEYFIEIHDTDFDLVNGFCTLQLALATGTATTIAAIGLFYPRSGGNYATIPSALT